jgi:hypothetical protein
VKKKLLAIIQAHTTPQTAAFAPMLQMALMSMSDEDVRELVAWIRSLLDGLEEA